MRSLRVVHRASRALSLAMRAPPAAEPLMVPLSVLEAMRDDLRSVCEDLRLACKDAKAETARVREDAKAETARVREDAKAEAARKARISDALVDEANARADEANARADDAKAEAARVRKDAKAEAARVREDAKALTDALTTSMKLLEQLCARQLAAALLERDEALGMVAARTGVPWRDQGPLLNH